MRVEVKFEPRDLWVGLYWKVTHRGCICAEIEHLDGSTWPHWHKERHFYVCLIPTLLVHVWLRTTKGIA